MRVNYKKVIPYPFDVVLGQYWDYEHIRFVHPETLGEYRLVGESGAVVTYEQIWPRRFFRRARSLVEQTRLAENEIEFVFVAGRHKGVRVHTFLHEHPEGTLVDETYVLKLPDWGWLRKLVEKQVMQSVEKIWQEDLDVQVCHGGWPGVPEAVRSSRKEAPGLRAGDELEVELTVQEINRSRPRGRT